MKYLKYVLLYLIALGIGITPCIASDFFVGDIPIGDKAYISTAPLGMGNGDFTIFNNSGNGGVVHGIATFNHPASYGIQKLKVTIDGNPERILLNGTAAMDIAAGGIVLPLKIRFKNSCIIKLNMSSSSPGTDNINTFYSLR